MHAHYTITFAVRLRKLCSHKVHAIQHHGTGKDHYMTGLVDNGQVIAKMAPGKVSQSEIVMMLWEVKLYVCAQIPLPSLVFPGEDAQVDTEAIQSHVCNASIFGPCYRSM